MIRNYCNLLLYLLFSFCKFSYSQNNKTKIHDGGLYNSIQFYSSNISFVPQAWFYVNDYYFETRYNYEDNETLSMYFGKSFSIKKKWNVEYIPMLGVSGGKLYGISPAINFQAKHKKFSTFSQCQYTFDINKSNSFFWDWSGVSFRNNKGFGIGGSTQIYVPISGESFIKLGPNISYKKGGITVDLSAYNFWEKYPTIAIGLECLFK